MDIEVKLMTNRPEGYGRRSYSNTQQYTINKILTSGIENSDGQEEYEQS